MIKRVYTGAADSGLHGCVVSLGDDSDAPLWWYDWKSPSLTKTQHHLNAGRFASIENRLNYAMLQSELFGTSSSRSHKDVRCHKYFLTYQTYHGGSWSSAVTLIKASGAVEATLSRFGDVFIKNDTTVRKCLINDGRSNKFAKLACALTLQTLDALSSVEFDKYKIITTETNVKSPNVKEAVALDFFDALAAAYVCRTEWRYGNWFDLAKMKSSIAEKLGAKRIYTSKELMG